MKSLSTTKYQSFKYFQQKYFKKLAEPNSLIEPLNLLCGGWSLQTFKQVINKLSTNRSSPLPLTFPSPDSLELITKSKALREQVFTAFDTRGLKRIDACQLYCALMVVSKGSYQIFLKSIVDVFGFEYQGRILRGEFWFFIDCFFRVVGKIVIIKGMGKPVELNARLEHEEINRFVKSIFMEKEEIQRNEIYQAMLREEQLGEFIKYIQKRCTTSAEKCRNQTIQRTNIESEVRAWLSAQIDKIEENLKQDRFEQFNKVLS